MRVLIVDDDPATRDVLERALAEERFSVEAAADGHEAERRARSDVFDVIVLDVILPDHDGLTVCRRLRMRGVDTPILLLTGRHGLEDRVRGLDAGADDYLTKPFALAELFARLRAVTRRGRTRQLDAVLRLGSIELNQIDRVVKVDGSAVTLTTTEMRLLECLLLRAGKVVTRDALAQHVWGGTISADSNVIDVYVSHLRKKLKPAVPLLRTIRRAGYTLAEQSEIR